MNFIRKNLLTTVAIIIVVGGGTYLWSQSRPAPKQESSTTSSSEKAKTVVTVTIKDGDNVRSYPLTSGVGKTALEVTQQAVDVKTTGTGENAYITAINGREASSDKKEYWELVINGQSSQVGAGSYSVKEGDTIEWKISIFS